MKSITHLSIFILLILLSCKPRPAHIDTSIVQQADTLITTWHQAAAKSSLEPYIGSMAQTGFYMGTDASERWGKNAFAEFCKPWFAKQKGWAFTKIERNIYVADQGNMIWWDELLDTKLGVCRGSGVMQLKQGKWQIEQYILSPTIPNELIDSVVHMKRAQDTKIINPSSR
jgi:hypothetical protein